MNRIEPSSDREVAEAISNLRVTGSHAVVVGGATMLGVAEHAPPADTLITTARLAGGIDHEPADLIVTAGAGTTLAELEAVLSASGQTLAVFHPEPDRATVGGLVAGGWQSPGRSVLGRLRDRVLQVHAVTGEGKAIKGGGKVVKNVTGFDIPRLLCGSVGTLAVLTRLSLKTAPAPRGLTARRMRGDDPRELSLAALRALKAARQPIEALVAGAPGDGYALTAVADGTSEDGADLLSAVPGDDLDDPAGALGAVASDPIQCPAEDAGAGMVVRIVTLRSRIPDVLSALPRGRLLVDVSAGLLWAGVPSDPELVGRLRADVAPEGGSVTLVSAAPELRREAGTFWDDRGPPGGVEVMARLKRQFDPDEVLGRGRLRFGGDPGRAAKDREDAGIQAE